ncbi:MAG: nucleotide exchange factor GrpE [Acidobacteriota bacterium]|nr:nucleotide exchange factor GrpE [Blastocatellia bacterium]MDW8240047.1 nucleotide exchange factor GrpE [Acidobacteriota bacterium]
MPKEAMEPVEARPSDRDSEQLNLIGSASVSEPSAATDEAPSEPLSELARLEQELEATRDQLLRTLADFDNYRRRMEREMDSRGHLGKREVIIGLLNVMDSFDQAAAWACADQQVAQGIQAIHRQLLALLESHGVRPFDSVGQLFDPAWHEAVGRLDAREAGVEPGVIVKEFQKGYRWHDKLLRPARVQVAQ